MWGPVQAEDSGPTVVAGLSEAGVMGLGSLPRLRLSEALRSGLTEASYNKAPSYGGRLKRFERWARHDRKSP